MAGAIDPHTHIGGGKMTIARALLPEDHRGDPVTRSELTRAGSGRSVPSTHVTGYRYAEMGYTAVFEPAMLASNARHAHLEMGDVPIVDHGAYVMLGNEESFLRLLASGAPAEQLRDYVGLMAHFDTVLPGRVHRARQRTDDASRGEMPVDVRLVDVELALIELEG